MADPTDMATTLDNLMAAHNGESNAHVRYAAFAKKADEEGYGKVASLFRAASRAEEIHAANHAAVIKKLGGDARADIQPVDVRSTKENLAAAIAGENYEKEIMYPDFIAKAERDGDKAALRTFNYALAAEIEHHALYSRALKELDSWKGGKKDFYVCPVCGKTVEEIGFDRCSVCSTLAGKFEKVN
jgi:rubrerythrin